MRFITRIYSDEMYEYVFHAFAIRGAQVFSSRIYGSLNIEPYCLYVYISKVHRKSSGNMRIYGYL